MSAHNRSFHRSASVRTNTLQNTSVHVPGVPSDDDLYDAGWAKHWDANRKAYYYYSIDGDQATTWFNPLAGGLNDASTLGGHQSFAGNSYAGSRHNPTVASIVEEDSDSSSSELEASFYNESQGSMALSALMGSVHNSVSLNRRQSFRQQASMRRPSTAGSSVATASRRPSAAGSTAGQSLRQSFHTAQSLQASVHKLATVAKASTNKAKKQEEEAKMEVSQPSLGASQSLGRTNANNSKILSPVSSHEDEEDFESEEEEEEGGNSEDDYDSFVTEEENSRHQKSSSRLQKSQNTNYESFQDEPTEEEPKRVFGGTNRKPLRMPRPKPQSLTADGQPKKKKADLELIAIEKEIEEAAQEVRERRQDYHALFEDERARYRHRKYNKLGACAICLLVLGGMALGGYFLGKSFAEQAQELANPSNITTSAPTTSPLVLTDYTELALENPLSIQATALRWLRDDPNYGTYSQQEKEARFALMCIYTATGGSSWQRTDSFVLPNSSYLMASHCDFPYYTCPGHVPSVTFAPVAVSSPAATAAPVATATTAPAPSTAPVTTNNATTAPANTTTAPGGRALRGGPVLEFDNLEYWEQSLERKQRLPPPQQNTHDWEYWEQSPERKQYWEQLQERKQRQQAQNTRSLFFDAAFGNGAILNLTDQGLLQGTLPPQMALLTELQTVHITNNAGLTGSIPDTIRFWDNYLFTMELWGNSLTGSIPTIMGQLRHLRTIHLQDNQLSGMLPDQLSLLSQMESLQLQNNQLTGTVPPSLATYPYIHVVNWANNKLSGTLPIFYVAGAMASQVRRIILHNNSFSGTIPTQLGGLSNLEVLQLHNNLQLIGAVPTEICALPKLVEISVDCNNVACGCSQCSCPTGGNPRNANLLGRLPADTQTAILAGNTPQSQAYNWMQTDNNLPTYPLEQQEQRFALAAFYYATGGDTWTTSTDWLNAPTAECTWASTTALFYRVPDAATDDLGTCAATTTSAGEPVQIYQSLRLPSNSLTGSLPPQVAMLTDLKRLELSDNNLAGSIPTHLNTLTALNVLDLERTKLVGTLPTLLLDLPQLNKLYLGDNVLTGPLPTELGKMSVVDTLQLNENQFAGALPTELANLGPNLQRLYLSANALTGFLSFSILGQLTNLVDMYLDNNDFIGNLDGLPFSSPSLAHVVLSANSLTGTIPIDFGTMASIQVLLLDSNQLDGSIPTALAGASATLQWLHLSNNLLVGAIPTQIGLLTQLVEFHAANNKLVGTIPIALTQCLQLRSLDLATNRLNGPIPPELRLFPSLTRLKIDHNDLTGSIPTELAGLSNSLTWIDASWNALGGTLPTELARMTNLEWMYFERNNIGGPISTLLGQLTKLQEMSLYGMQLTGTIPTELGLLSTSLTGLFLHENYLEGPIPSQLGQLTTLSSLWLHQLSLTGTVPAELCNLLTNGNLNTLAVDCNKVTCTCGCSCPTEGGDVARENPTLPSTARWKQSSATRGSAKGATGNGNIFRHWQ